MSFPPYPAKLEKQAWETQEKKSKLSTSTGIGKELEELKKEYNKIDTDAFEFAGLEKIKSPMLITKRRSEVDQELKKLPGLRQIMAAFDKLAGKKITELKKAKADAAAIKLLEEIQDAAYGFYEDSKELPAQVEEELHKIEETINGRKGEEEKEDEAAPGADKFLLAGWKFCKSKPGIFAFAIGKENHLLLGQRIAPALLTEAKKKTGGKFIRGECFCEENTYVFQVQIEPPGGLARKIKKAILDQSVGKLKPKVMVRGPNGAEINDENDTDNLATDIPLEDVAESAEGDTAAAGAAADPAGAQAPAVKPNGDGIAVVKRLVALTSDYKAALARLGPNGSALQALYEKTRQLVDAKKFSQAALGLDALEKKVAEAKTAPAGAGTGGPGKAVGGWQNARVEAINQIRKLQTLVVKTKHRLVGETVRVIEGIVKQLAPEIKTKQQAAGLAKYLATDPEVSDLEGTVLGGVSFSIRPRLVNALAALQNQLPA